MVKRILVYSIFFTVFVAGFTISLQALFPTIGPQVFKRVVAQSGAQSEDQIPSPIPDEQTEVSPSPTGEISESDASDGDSQTDTIENNFQAAQEEQGQVVHVVDGDTIDVKEGEKIVRIRLIGVNTPEVVDPKKPVQCFGQQASDETKRLLLGAQVTLETDVSQANKDTYGRYLRYVYLDDGTDFNEYLIEQGFGREYTFMHPYVYQPEFRQAQADAKRLKKGLWAPQACPKKPST